MNQKKLGLSIISYFIFLSLFGQSIPLPEHPRPDFERKQWENLNGEWNFAFDSLNIGIQENWAAVPSGFDKKITVPFPWGSALSGVADEADIAWYHRTISVAEQWKNKRTFLTIGASDWETTVWLDGQLIGKHQGGYVPFSFELTDFIQYDQAQDLVIRVDDARRDFTLYGKQGYGNARGIWQTIYLESRGQNYLEALHFTPDIDNELVQITAYLASPAERDVPIQLTIKTNSYPMDYQITFPKGQTKFSFEIDIDKPRLWTIKDPFLHEVNFKIGDDEIKSYFGMRKISVENLPNTEIPYIALNGKPIYLQLALDQSYHPDGFYTFPSDQFIKEEIERSKSIGLNGIRTHIKVEVPRKLYWADKLGLLVMEDLPNSWGEPDEKMQMESTYTLKEMIKRDYNHPSIFSWVIFNETWGLFSKTKGKQANGKPKYDYLPSTQQWVASMYYLAKSLDPSRLVEDNSICCGRGHTETDIYSWHVYLPGWEWDNYLKNLTDNNYPGSTFDFEKGFQQEKQPNINSECGNVWGYDGSTGDVDWSWDYHRMINSFRQYPKVGGWLYTEHHDVVNEWNGYWRFDRTEKETGLGDIVTGMSLNDLHAPVYLSTGNEICKTVKAGRVVEIPLFLSSMTSWQHGDQIILDYELTHTNVLGNTQKISDGQKKIAYQPYMQQALAPLNISMPTTSGIATLKFKISTKRGKVLHRNFMHFEVLGGKPLANANIISIPAKNFSQAEWSKKQWQVLEGKKINGAGKGFFEYTFDIPKNFPQGAPKESYFLVEVSAKELFVKDMEEYDKNQDFMRGSIVAPSSNPNAYPMTDETLFPSTIKVLLNGQEVHSTTLKDDPADHRGVLSWHNQLKDRKLREAGSYGYLVKVTISPEMLISVNNQEGKLTIRLATQGDGGIAVYGKDFGRYMLDPSVVFEF